MQTATSSTRRRIAALVASVACAAALGAAGPAAAQPTAPEPGGCKEAELHPEYQNQGNCSDSPPPTAQPDRPNPLPLGLDIILGGLFAQRS